MEQQVTNLINLINPLSFTVDLIDPKQCDGNVERITIEDDIVIVNGMLYIKRDTE